MRKKRTNNRVNNTAANAAQSSTILPAGATKTAADLYGIDIVTAYDRIMEAKAKGDLTVRVMPNGAYIKAAAFDPEKPNATAPITNAFRKEACVIAGETCWQPEAKCYRAWVSAKHAYVIDRAKWLAAKAAHEAEYKTAEPIAQEPAPVVIERKPEAAAAPTAEGFTRKQVFAIVKHLNPKATAKDVENAIRSLYGVPAIEERSSSDAAALEVLGLTLKLANSRGLRATYEARVKELTADIVSGHASIESIEDLNDEIGILRSINEDIASYEKAIAAASQSASSHRASRRNRRMNNIG